MTRFVSVCVCAAVVFAAMAGVRLVSPAAVLAADAIVGLETPLHESPDAGSPLLAVLPEGTAITIEGPPVDGFYPVSAAGMLGWLIGETLLVQKDVAAEPAPEEDGETPAGEEAVPVEQTASEEPPPDDPAAKAAPAADATAPATEPITSEPTPDPASASTDPALGAPATDPTPAKDGSDSASAEPASADMSADVTPTSGDPAPTDDSASVAPAATPVPEAATATPAVDGGPWGPASTMVNMPVYSGPDPGTALIFTVPQGSAVEQTGQAANGYISVRYKEVVGWSAAEHLGPPIEVVPEILSAETGEPVDTKTPRPGSGVAYTTVDISLRDQPSASGAPLAAIPAGSRVVLTGVMEYDFQRVNFKDQIGWVANQFLANPPNPEASEERRADYRTYSEQQIIKIIYSAADQYGQSREDMLRVARCESNLDPYAVNPSGSYGLFQFIRATWKSTPYGSADVFDPKANAGAAAWMWSEGRKSEWVCQ